MNVLRAANHVGEHHIQKTLTTRFVSDWRMKPYDQSTKRWLRRAPLVARKYAFEGGRRDDAFNPVSPARLLRLLPPLYLAKLSETDYVNKFNNYEDLLGSFDIKDAFFSCSERTLEGQIGKRAV